MIKLGLIFIFIIISLLPVFSQDRSSDQVISIDQNDWTVKQVLDEIARQSGFNFSYNAKIIDPRAVISFGIRKVKLEEALELLKRNISVDYFFVDQQIVLTRAEEVSTIEIVEETNFTVSGYMTDQSTGESLIGATVSIAGTSQGTTTNAFGYFALRISKGEHSLLFSYVGYQEKKIPINLRSDLSIDVKLVVTSIDLPNVIVTLPARQVINERDLGRMELNPISLATLPEFGGEAGLIKGLQTLPGIKTHSDGSAFFYVRGGDRDQNLIILDDAPIFNPAHLFGFYSMVIPEATKEIKVYKSDIPANLGDRLSSIVSIRTKDGNLNKWSFSGSLNPLVNRFALEIPVIKERASIYTSIRRSNFEWLYQKNNPNLDLAFGDFNFKWNSKIGKKDRLFFTLITGSDVLADLSSSSGISWANIATTLRWNHLFGPRLFLNTTIYSGSYNYRLSLQNNSWESGIGTISLKSDFNHYINPGLKANFGFEVAAYGFNPGRISEGNLLSIFPEINQRITQKRTLYYQLEQKLSNKWQWSAGLRMPSWSNVGPDKYFTFDEDYRVRDTISQPEGFYNAYVRLDPRVSARYLIDSTAHIQLSLGRYHQFLQLISNSVSPFTSLEVWLPSGPNIRPQSAIQLDLDYLKYLPKSGLSVLIGIYFKQMKNQIDYVGHANTVLNPLLEGELRFGQMKTYGCELLLEKEVGRLRGALSYTYSRAIRQTPELNGGREYPAFQDRPHDLSFMINYRLSDRFLFSGYWTAFSGSAFSSPTGYYRYKNQTIPIYDNKNNDRLPGYQRLDLSFTYRLNRNPANRFDHSLIFSAFNALAHKNIIAVDFNKVSEEGKPIIPVDFLTDRDLISSRTDLIRFFPSLTYKFKI